MFVSGCATCAKMFSPRAAWRSGAGGIPLGLCMAVGVAIEDPPAAGNRRRLRFRPHHRWQRLGGPPTERRRVAGAVGGAQAHLRRSLQRGPRPRSPCDCHRGVWRRLGRMHRAPRRTCGRRRGVWRCRLGGARLAPRRRRGCSSGAADSLAARGPPHVSTRNHPNAARLRYLMYIRKPPPVRIGWLRGSTQRRVGCMVLNTGTTQARWNPAHTHRCLRGGDVPVDNVIGQRTRCPK